MANTRSKLQRLVLSATEIRSETGWSDAMTEDYLNILNDLITLSDTIDNSDANAAALIKRNEELIQSVAAEVRKVFSQLNKERKRIDKARQFNHAW